MLFSLARCARDPELTEEINIFSKYNPKFNRLFFRIFLCDPCGLCERQRLFLSPASLEAAERTEKDKIPQHSRPEA
jgi:hypothetical protein